MKYRAEIDGLRALAVLPVILFHAGFEWFSGGFVGVDVFFVISGYLITTIIISEIAEGKFSIINFYERRARRILPALFFVMAACLPFAWLWLTPNDLKDFGQSLMAVSTFSSNIFFWLESGYFDTAAELKPLLHTWSLAVEEQYYILFPIFLMLTWRLGIKWVLVLLSVLFLLSLGVAQWGAYNKPTAAFFLLPTRGWELLVGVFAAFYLKYNTHLKSHILNQALSLIGFGMIVYSIIVFDKTTPFPSLYTLIPTIGTGLLILCAVPKTFIHKLLSLKFIVGIGLISYSAYLWHQPLLAFARHRSFGEVADLFLIALCSASLVLAWFSWRFVEAPFRDKRKFSKLKIFTISIFSITFFCLIGLILHFGNFKFNTKFLAVKSEAIEQRNDGECFRLKHQASLYDCVRGDIGEKPKYALLGDSHASAIAFELSNIFLQNNLSFVQYTKTGCPPIFELIKKNNERCSEFIGEAVKDINERGITHIILFARWPYYTKSDDYDNGYGYIERRGGGDIYSVGEGLLSDEPTLREEMILQGFSEFILYLNEMGLKVYVIRPVPVHAWDVTQFSVSQKPIKYKIYDERVKRVTQLFDDLERKNIAYLLGDLAALCPLVSAIEERYCISSKQQELLYYDDDHLSNLGVRIYLSKEFNEVLLLEN